MADSFREILTLPRHFAQHIFRAGVGWIDC
jgi:hypothetical protein